MEQRTPEWFAARKGRVTGSSVGSILGLNPWATSDDVMRRMVREYHGAESEFKGNVATVYGTVNEPNALADYELETGNTVVECGFYTIDDWLGASPDGLIGDDGLLEIKCPYGKRGDFQPEFKPLSEQMHYYAQIQIQLYCTNRAWCDFYQWTPYGSKLEHVKLDIVWLAENLPKLELFHEVYLTARKPENAYRYLDGGPLVAAFRMAQAAMEVAKIELEEAKQALIDATNEKGGKIGDINITYVTKDGVISYSKYVKDVQPNADLEPYRGAKTGYWRVK